MGKQARAAKETQKALNRQAREQRAEGIAKRYGLYITTIKYLGMVHQAMGSGNRDAAVKLSKAAVGNEAIERSYGSDNTHVNVHSIVEACEKCLTDIQNGLVQFGDSMPLDAVPVGETDPSDIVQEAVDFVLARQYDEKLKSEEASEAQPEQS